MPEVDPELRSLIRGKAREAANRGTNDALWRDWRQTVVSSGLTIDVAVGLIPREAQRWFARFCFKAGLDQEGVDAYERLLDSNGDARWVYAGEGEPYLVAVSKIRGPAAVILAFEKFDAFDHGGYPSLERIVADAESDLGLFDRAVARMRRVTAQYHTDGDNHAALARHAMSTGLFEDAHRHLVAAAKRGVVVNGATIDLGALGVDAATLAEVAAEYATPGEDELLRRFVDHPGLTLLPAEPGAPDAFHTFGGDGGFTVPNCPGCARKLLLLGAIDTAVAAKDEPTLAPLTVALPRLPILHCDNCQLMFRTPDFRIDESGRRIDIFSVGSAGTRNTIFDSKKDPAPQPARLVAPERPSTTDTWDAAEHLDRQRDLGPQFGGYPRPINEPRRRFCPNCDAEQIFYAAVCTVDAFDTRVVVNPDGYMYWFACPGCRILSTDLDNT